MPSFPAMITALVIPINKPWSTTPTVFFSSLAANTGSCDNMGNRLNQAQRNKKKYLNGVGEVEVNNIVAVVSHCWLGAINEIITGGAEAENRAASFQWWKSSNLTNFGLNELLHRFDWIVQVFYLAERVAVAERRDLDRDREARTESIPDLRFVDDHDELFGAHLHWYDVAEMCIISENDRGTLPRPSFREARHPLHP